MNPKLLNRKLELEILIPIYQEKQQYNKANELILEYKKICKILEEDRNGIKII